MVVAADISALSQQQKDTLVEKLKLLLSSPQRAVSIKVRFGTFEVRE